MPVTQLSTRAGESISWGANSDQLYWTLGPELYQVSLDNDYREKNAKDKVQVTEIGFQTEMDVPRGTIAFVGGKIITMENDRVIDKGVVLVKDNHIQAVGEAGMAIPDDAMLVDISGKTLMPGLFDAHAHGAQGESEIIPQQNWQLYAGLALGVTSIHDPSNDTTEILLPASNKKPERLLVRGYSLPAPYSMVPTYLATPAT